jgi:hypothetical protein
MALMISIALKMCPRMDFKNHIKNIIVLIKIKPIGMQLFKVKKEVYKKNVIYSIYN